jgi:predicted GNAT family acetyltransferase
MIAHDEIGQKFTMDVDGIEYFLAYTVINENLNVHFMAVPDGQSGEEIAEALALAAFEFARKSGVKIISSSAYVDEIFLKRHPEYVDLLETW